MRGLHIRRLIMTAGMGLMPGMFWPCRSMDELVAERTADPERRLGSREPVRADVVALQRPILRSPLQHGSPALLSVVKGKDVQGIQCVDRDVVDAQDIRLAEPQFDMAADLMGIFRQ